VLNQDGGPALLLLDNDVLEAILDVDDAPAEKAVELYSLATDSEALKVAMAFKLLELPF
jgi:hypothetical protein